ncbi:MAG TPA: DNA recombination protein RmuC [Bryobacteraceae bacterium]|jgi:DNA recombination protein RmuC
MFWALAVLAAAAIALAAWLYSRAAAESAVLRTENSRLIAAEADLRARLDAERSSAADKIRMLTDARDQIRDQFQALSAEALERNNRQFLELARCELSRHQSEAQGELDLLVKPLVDSLARVDEKIHSIELARAGAYSALTDQVRNMSEQQVNLREETRRLTSALKSPITRGRWGEIQLKRVVELAGMTAHCDFIEQVTLNTDDGRLRPDMIVRLPNGREVVVDSKVSLSAYLESLEASTEAVAVEKARQHAQQVRKHIDRLGQKSYASQFQQAPDFVVAFLPGETFFSAALQHQPDLIEYGVRNNVVLATPTTLIALLRAIAYGWRERQLAQNAEEIRELGAELYDRIRVFAEHYSEVGSAINKAVGAYNRGRSSLDARLLSTARKFEDLGVERKRELGEVIAIDTAALAPEKLLTANG